ncbi:MAG: hypothetical protein ACETVS_01700 [Dehalococcoidales bacterium]
MCYTVPLVAAIGTTIMWKQRKGAKTWWLNLMLYGGVLFGIVDHIWHGELFLISDSVAADFSLGGAITAAVFACWGIIISLSKLSPSLARYLSIASE